MKACECGCGNEVTREGNRYLLGHFRTRGFTGKIPWNKGLTKEDNPHLAQCGGGPAWNKGLTVAEDERIPSGERLAHRPPPANKGKIVAEVPRYEAVHARLQQLRIGKCSNCGKQCNTHMALICDRGYLMNADGPRAGLWFSDDPNDYWELCPKCHARYDRDLI